MEDEVKNVPFCAGNVNESVDIKESVQTVAPDENKTNPQPTAATILEVGDAPKDKKPNKEDWQVRISAKDYSWLKKNRYEEVREKFKTVFVLQHRKFPDKIVELRAATATHACNLIHWKPNQVRLIETRTVETEDLVDNINNSILSAGYAKSNLSVI